MVAGDMNVLPNSETFEVLGGIGLTDLVGASDTRTSAYAKPVPPCQRSWSRLKTQLLCSRYLKAEAVDHRPLVLDLKPLSGNAP